MTRQMAWFVIALGKPAGNFQVSGVLISHLVITRSSGNSFDQFFELWSVGVVLSFPEYLY